MIHEQGDMIGALIRNFFIFCSSITKFSPFLILDSIEANVDSAQIHVEQGSSQIAQAARYQVRFLVLRFFLLFFFVFTSFRI